MKYHQTSYRIKNPHKYKGNLNEVFARSSWELEFLNWCDNSSFIVEFASEEIVIPYVSPVDNRIHRYFVDFYLKMKDKDDEIKEYLIEIKPENQIFAPKKQQKQTKQYIDKIMTYGINKAKWAAAIEYCDKRNMTFLLLSLITNKLEKRWKIYNAKYI